MYININESFYSLYSADLDELKQIERSKDLDTCSCRFFFNCFRFLFYLFYVWHRF